MTNKQHTVGPWSWWTSNSFRRLSGADGRDGGVLYPTVQRDGHPDVCFPNGGAEGPDARLIAAAPALLAALEEVEDFLDNRADVVDGSYGEPAPNREMQLLQEVRAALSLARGEQS